MIAILLAGGKGSCLGKSGRLIPKPLVPISNQPIINHIVDQLMALRDAQGKPLLRMIYILLRKTQRLDAAEGDSERTLNLERDFNAWQSVWYGEDREDNKRIELIFEDDILKPTDSLLSTVLKVLHNSQTEQAKIFAMGEGTSERFVRFNASMPVLPFTTSVSYLMELMMEIIE